MVSELETLFGYVAPITPLPSPHPADTTKEAERVLRWKRDEYVLPPLTYPRRNEIQADANNGARFSNLPPVGSDLRSAKNVLAFFPEELFVKLAGTWKDALSIREADLVESFLMARGQRRFPG